MLYSGLPGDATMYGLKLFSVSQIRKLGRSRAPNLPISLQMDLIVSCCAGWGVGRGCRDISWALPGSTVKVQYSVCAESR